MKKNYGKNIIIMTKEKSIHVKYKCQSHGHE